MEDLTPQALIYVGFVYILNYHVNTHLLGHFFTFVIAGCDHKTFARAHSGELFMRPILVSSGCRDLPIFYFRVPSVGREEKASLKVCVRVGGYSGV